MTPTALCSVAKLTSGELATLAKVDRKTVVRVLTGRCKRAPNPISIERVGVALNQRLSELKRETVSIEQFHAWVLGQWTARRASQP